jgi:glycogen debranching enzyme
MHPACRWPWPTALALHTGNQVRSSEHDRKERILTHSDPAKVGKTTGGVVLKSGSLFLIATEGGDVPFEGPHGYGLYFHDCRFLDGYALRVNGTRPLTLAGTADRAFRTHHHLTMGSPTAPGRRAASDNTIGILRERVVRGGAIHERTTLRNYGRVPARLRVQVTFRARFEDVFIVKGFVRGPRGHRRPPEVHGGQRVVLGYDGRDDVLRVTHLAFAPSPARLTGGAASFDVVLAPEAEQDIEVLITPCETARGEPARQTACPPMPAEALQRWPARAEAVWVGSTSQVRTSSPLLERVYGRARLDLHLLRSRLDGLDYFAAGVPWFGTLFGRDAAVVALQTLPFGTGVARQTLRLLARYQAQATDAYRDAEPGKILHEYRAGELAHLHAVPQSPAYYGSIDATPLFLILLAEYVRWSGDVALARELMPHAEAALGWMADGADSDGDGFLDYRGRYPNGLVNQGWKDSGNAIVNADGSLADPPIALCEVQAYAFRAWRQMAGLRRTLGDAAGAEALERQAEALRVRFERDFWDEALGCYVLARQAGGRAAAVVTSNAGQVLWGGLADPARAARVAERLLAEDMFSGWGVRTLSSEAAAYNPMSYHLGSVWPHDNGLILAGLLRYGLDAPALRIFHAVFEAATRFHEFRLPELFCGFPRRDAENQPVCYPVACSPQAWAAGALPHALWSLLGLSADAPAGTLTVVRPRLPPGVNDLALDALVVGEARVDLRFRRTDDRGAADVETQVRRGDVKVEVTETLPAPGAFG